MGEVQVCDKFLRRQRSRDSPFGLVCLQVFRGPPQTPMWMPLTSESAKRERGSSKGLAPCLGPGLPPGLAMDSTSVRCDAGIDLTLTRATPTLLPATRSQASAVVANAKSANPLTTHHE